MGVDSGGAPISILDYSSLCYKNAYDCRLTAGFSDTPLLLGSQAKGVLRCRHVTPQHLGKVKEAGKAGRKEHHMSSPVGHLVADPHSVPLCCQPPILSIQAN